jgi:hypothetical protein
VRLLIDPAARGLDAAAPAGARRLWITQVTVTLATVGRALIAGSVCLIVYRPYIVVLARVR